jgi:hypothetical protein
MQIWREKTIVHKCVLTALHRYTQIVRFCCLSGVDSNNDLEERMRSQISAIRDQLERERLGNEALAAKVRELELERDHQKRLEGMFTQLHSHCSRISGNAY